MKVGFQRQTNIQVRGGKQEIKRNGIMNASSSHFPHQIFPSSLKSNIPSHSFSINIPLHTPSLTQDGNISPALSLIPLTALQPHWVLSVSTSRLFPLPITSISPSITLIPTMTPSGKCPSHSIRVPVGHSHVTTNTASPPLCTHTPALLLSYKLHAGTDCVSWLHHCIWGPARYLTPGRFSKHICSVNDCPHILTIFFFFFFLQLCISQWNLSSHHLTTNCFPRFQAPLAPIQSVVVTCQPIFLKHCQNSPLL